jgi:cytochrome c oxidase assembly factor CtaG
MRMFLLNVIEGWRMGACFTTHTVSHITLNPMTAPRLVGAMPDYIAMYNQAVEHDHFTLHSYDDDLSI